MLRRWVACNWDQLQPETGRARYAAQRVYRRLAATVSVGTEDRAIKARTARQLSLPEPAATADLGEEGLSKCILARLHSPMVA